MSLGMSYVQVSTGLHIDFSGVSPPYFFSWPHESTAEVAVRNVFELASDYGIQVG